MDSRVPVVDAFRELARAPSKKRIQACLEVLREVYPDAFEHYNYTYKSLVMYLLKNADIDTILKLEPYLKHFPLVYTDHTLRLDVLLNRDTVIQKWGFFYQRNILDNHSWGILYDSFCRINRTTEEQNAFIIRYIQSGVFPPLLNVVHNQEILDYMTPHMSAAQMARYLRELLDARASDHPHVDACALWLHEHAQLVRAVLEQGGDWALRLLVASPALWKSTEFIQLMFQSGLRLDTRDDFGHTLGECISKQYAVLDGGEVCKILTSQSALFQCAQLPSIKYMLRARWLPRMRAQLFALLLCIKRHNFLHVCGRFSRESFWCILRAYWTRAWLAPLDAQELYRARALLRLAEIYSLSSQRRYAHHEGVPFDPKDTSIVLVRRIFNHQVRDIAAFQAKLLAKGQHFMEHNKVSNKVLMEQFAKLKVKRGRGYSFNQKLETLLLCRAFPMALADKEPPAKKAKFELGTL